jgi:hypothetical protein
MMGRGLKVLALPALVLATFGGFDSTEIHCEEAIAHLQSCCAVLEVPNVCGGQTCAPDITLTAAESDCILATPCGPEARALCDRVKALSESVGKTTDWPDSTAATNDGSHGVCP